MHRFIQSNKNKNSLTFVTKYNWPVEVELNGKAVLLQIDHLEDIVNIAKHRSESTKLVGFVYRNDYASFETIDVDPKWGSIAVILYINRLGQFRDVYHKLNFLKSLNVMVIFTGKEEQATRDAQVLSSMGIHSGIVLSPDSELSEHVLDLLIYNFYGCCNHAEIEPFSTISKYYDGSNYVSPNVANFINPDRYIYIDKDMRLAFSQKDLDENNNVYNIGDLKKEALSEIIGKEDLKWQDFFIESHPCTFCPAFRICLGYFDYEKNGKKCRKVMSELLEAIEFDKKVKSQNNIERCQP